MSIYKNGKLVAGGSQALPLLTFMWADHILDNVSWLRADTFSWQSGAVYQAAYNHLAQDVSSKLALHIWSNNENVLAYTIGLNPSVGDTVFSNSSLTEIIGTISGTPIPSMIVVNNQSYLSVGSTSGTPLTETVSGITITYYLSDDGHKIVLADQETNANAIYTATGVAWYYIVDLNNKRFKLPRAKHEHYGNRQVIGNGITLGLTDGTTNLGLGNLTSTSRVRPLSDMYGVSVGTVTSSGSVGVNNASIGLTTDGTKSGIISTPVEDTDQYKHLYFYVGNFTQTALQNTAGINAELFNDKVDVGHEIIAFQAPTADNNYTWYRKYADGWVEQGGVVRVVATRTITSTINLPITMSNNNYTISATAHSPARATYLSWAIVSTVANPTTTTFDYQCYGVSSSDVSDGLDWQVSGMVA